MPRQRCVCEVLFCALAAQACAAEPPGARSSEPPAVQAHQLQKLHSLEQDAVDRILAENSAPAAAVVLSLNPVRLLATGGVNGADPARHAFRPGSTLKPLVAWIAGAAGLLDPADTVHCNRDFRVPGFHCFGAHGPLGLREAITTSCNIYFFELATRLGASRLSAGLMGFGVGRPTGLVAGEASGFIATPGWAAARRNAATAWELAVAAGHGPVEVTLLQLAHAYAELSHRLEYPKGAVTSEVREQIRAALRAVVADEHGTGRRASVVGLDIAGKTGTADPGAFAADAPPGARLDTQENGWFVGFTPVEQPKILVAAVVLGRGSARDTAAPLAGRIFQRLRSMPSGAATGRATLARRSVPE